MQSIITREGLYRVVLVKSESNYWCYIYLQAVHKFDITLQNLIFKAKLQDIVFDS